jgi:hypothetical protein
MLVLYSTRSSKNRRSTYQGVGRWKQSILLQRMYATLEQPRVIESAAIVTVHKKQ